jgi:Tol biopolymer transport system component
MIATMSASRLVGAIAIGLAWGMSACSDVERSSPTSAPRQDNTVAPTAEGEDPEPADVTAELPLLTFTGYACDDEDYDHFLYLVRPDGAGLHRLTNSVDRWESDATWAPDGASVAFLGGPLDGASDPGIFVATADGTNETRLADASENLQWTPESEALLYGMGPIGVHQVSADGTKRGLLLEDVWWDEGELSPDGGRVAATARYPNPDVVIVVELAGSGREEYSAGPGTYAETRWSPDGRYLAFLRKPRVPGQVDDDFKRDVYVLDTATGSLQNVTNTPEASEAYLSWSPDGEWLVYNVYRDGIWTIRRDGTDARRLVRMGGNSLASLSPDGRYLAVANEERSQVWIGNADGSDMRTVSTDAVCPFTNGDLAWKPLPNSR